MPDVTEFIAGSATNFIPKIPITGIIYGATILGVGMVALKLWWPNTYPILVGVKRKVGNGVIQIFDHARIVSIEGVRNLYLTKLNRYLPVPDNKFFYPFRRGFFKKWYLDMYVDSNDEVLPTQIETVPKSWREKVKVMLGGKIMKKATKEVEVVEFNDQEYVKTLVPKKREMELWAQMHRKRLQARYAQDWVAKYGFVVSQGIAVVLLLGMTLIIMNKYGEMTELFTQAFNQAMTVMQAMRGT